MRNPEARFWAMVEAQGECWVWTGFTKRGYGQFRAAQHRTVQAHRFAYEHMVGEIPDGLQIDHLCRNKRCVNPQHMEPVPGIVNTRRWQLQDGRLAGATQCPHGHPYDDGNTYIDRQGKRRCRECGRNACRAYRNRKVILS